MTLLFKRSKGKNIEGVSDSADLGARTPASKVESIGLFLLEDDPPTTKFDIDIVAVHGLGGNWEKTWRDSESRKVWLRDFLPSQLRDSGINPRIFSYGYDATTAFSRSIQDINDVADDLLVRLSYVRPNMEEKRRPILLIAHSLGGLIAIITAWNESNQYGELLQSIQGLIFFGVPHRGADLAYWAGLPASLLDHALIGFGGNTNFLNALKRASPTWRDISRDFIQRAAPPLMIRTFFETERLGNILVVDKDSARLYLPNEQFSGVATSNHRSMCRFGNADSQKYAPVWMSIRDMAQKAIASATTRSFGNREPIVITDAPCKTPSFFGREPELKIMLEFLKRGDSEQKSVILWGLSGFGKTQLALQFQFLHARHYTSKIWIDARMLSQVELLRDLTIDVAEIEGDLATTRIFPSLDLSSNPTLSFLPIKTWLAKDTNKNWLMIIDNVEDLDGKIAIQQLIPECCHGTIIVTTTRRNLASVLRQPGIEIRRIDEAAGVNMLLDEFPTRTYSNEELQLLRDLVCELDGVPLSIKQAAVHLSVTPTLSVTNLQRYAGRLKLEYQHMMAIKPDMTEWCYDKNRSIIQTFSILKETLVKTNKDSLWLLTVASFFAASNIPMVMVDREQRQGEELPADLSLDMEDLKALNTSGSPFFKWFNQLNQIACEDAITTLPKFCCLQVSFNNNGTIRDFTIQEAIRRWCQEALPPSENEEWAMIAAYRISDCLRPYDVPITTAKFLPHVQQAERALFEEKAHACRQAPDGNLCQYAWFISLRFAYFYYRHKYFNKARKSMERAIDYERLIRGEGWMTTPQSLKRMLFFAKALRDQGDFSKALESLEALLPACEKVLGIDDNLTIEVGTLSTTIRIRVLENNHNQQRVLTPLVKQQQRVNSRSLVPNTLTTQTDYTAILPEDTDLAMTDTEYPLREIVRGFTSEYGKENEETLEALYNLTNFCAESQKFEEASSLFKIIWQIRARSSPSTTLALRPFYDYIKCSKEIGYSATTWKGDCPYALIYAIRNCYHALVEILIKEQFDISICNERGQSALHEAAACGHELVVKLLLDKGAEVDSKNNDSCTPLSEAASQGHESVVKLLLDNGAKVDSKNDYGRTPLSEAASQGHESVVKLLLDKVAQVDSKNIDSCTPLSEAASQGHESVVKLLLDNGAKVDSKTNDSWTPLLEAASQGHESVVKLLLDNGAKVDSKTNSSWTPLSIAASLGHESVVKLLLDKGAKVDSKTNNRWTPLHFAAYIGHELVMRLLVERGAELDSKDNEGQTPLSLAIEERKGSLIKLLVEKGARVDSKDNKAGLYCHWLWKREMSQ